MRFTWFAETLVLWGKQDRLISPVYGERWIQLIPGARLVQIDAAGHMLPYEQPKAFVSVVANFLGTAMEPLDLTGAVALDTGGSRGLGRELALPLPRCCADVMLATSTKDAHDVTAA